MKVCVVVPHYHHHEQIGAVLHDLQPLALDIIIIDDGSDTDSVSRLRVAVSEFPRTTLVERRNNGGKGAAVKTGIRAALERGYTHVLQIDADGQHTIADAEQLLRTAARQPDALITGAPVFADDMPRSRRWGRYLTHFCVALETLSRRPGDTMCGFRIYPVKTITDLLRRYNTGDRMDFDIEIVVKADWAGIPIVHVPTTVHYPDDGVSHFDYVSDNARITAMHIRLIVGMLAQSPRLISRWFRQRPG